MRNGMVGARRVGVALVLTLGLGACGTSGGSGGAASTGAATQEPSSGAASEAAQPASIAAQASSAGAPAGQSGGTLTMDGETIDLASTLCYLEQQPDVNGGTLDFDAQGSGTNAAGEAVHLDVTRYAADTSSPGDLVVVDIGPFENIVEYVARLDLNTVSLDGNVVSVTDAVLHALEQQAEATVSFEIMCRG